MQLLEYLTDLSSTSYNFMCPSQFWFYAWCLSLITMSLITMSQKYPNLDDKVYVHPKYNK